MENPRQSYEKKLPQLQLIHAASKFFTNQSPLFIMFPSGGPQHENILGPPEREDDLASK